MSSAAPRKDGPSWQDKWQPLFIGLLASFLTMPVFFMLLSEAARERIQLLLALGYPLPTLLGHLFSGLGNPVICLMLGQFALYGLAISLLSGRHPRRRAAIWVLCAHCAGMLLAWAAHVIAWA